MSEVSLVDGHIDNGLSDEDIIKALECCIKNDCDNCPFDSLLNYSDCLKGFLDLINRQKAEIERLKQKPLYDFYKEKSEAIKEFAERLKEKATSTFYEEHKYVDTEDIDNLVKEMTESK